MPTEVFHLKPKVGLWKSRNNWKYDNIDQLTEATHPALPEENFTYNPLGNRNPLTHTYDSANRLLSDGQYSYTYDSNGNRIAKEDIDTGEIITYTYNAANQLITINYPLSTINYFYDGLGRRIEKNVGGTITRYIYDGMDILAEYNSANELIRKYVHGPSIDEPLELTSGASTYYYISDELGSITALIDGTGSIVEQYRYDSFGNVIILNSAGEEIPESVYSNSYMFTAREYDTETGLYYYRLRYYDPLVGRFLQEDPVGYLLGPNLYTYVNNNPVNWIDPWGLWTIQIGGTGSGGGAVGGTGGGGIIIGYSKKGGFQVGVYGTAGGGSYVGAGGSGTVSITWSKNPHIEDVSGRTMTIGGSGKPVIGPTVGGDINKPFDSSVRSSYTLDVGGGVGIPAEGHAYITNTWVKKLWGREKSGNNKEE